MSPLIYSLLIVANPNLKGSQEKNFSPTFLSFTNILKFDNCLR